MFAFQLLQNSACTSTLALCGDSSKSWVTEDSERKMPYDGGRFQAGPHSTRVQHQDEFSWTSKISQHNKCGQSRQALVVYDEMRTAGVEPSSYTFVAALKACINIHDVETGKKIHDHAVERGLESHLFVANVLVDFYAKCGNLVKANCVFEKMSHRDVISWNSMILGYAQMAMGDVAMELYSRMKNEHVMPNSRTFVSALKACSIMASLKAGNQMDEKFLQRQFLMHARTIYIDIVECGVESDIFVGTMLVDVYAKCGSLLDARHIFENMCCRNVVAWTAMIQGYAQTEEADVALHLYERMRIEGIAPNNRTYVAVLQACSYLVDCTRGDATLVQKQCLEQTRAIHSDLVKGTFELDVYVGSMLLEVYLKCRKVLDARNVFEMMPRHDVVSCTAMILGYVQMEDNETALQLYERMHHAGIIPDAAAFVSILKACSNLARLKGESEHDGNSSKEWCLKQVKTIHLDVINGGFESDLFVGNMLVDAYAKCGSLVDARYVFEKMPHRDVVSWTTLIAGFVQMDENELALDFYKEMQQAGVAPDARAYVGALKACNRLAAGAQSQRHDQEILLEWCLSQIRIIHSHISKGKYQSDVTLGNLLVDAYAKCGSLEDARSVFEKLPDRDVVSWTTMILSYAQAEDGERALLLYARMQQEGVTPNDRTFVGALKACCVVAGLEKGKEIHAEIAKTGLQATNPFVASSLIDMYAKCGSMIDAQQVFDAFQRQDIVTWNALIAGYAHQGESDCTFRMFERMRLERVQPEGITFVSVLTVCSHVGLVDKGCNYFEGMNRDFGIMPSIEHYTCMVDLLGRAGQLDKAMALVQTMPLEPNGVLWRTLLGACQKWRNVELGRHAFDCAVRLNSHDVAAYVLMSNIYGAADMHENMKEIRAMMMRIRAGKSPGLTWWSDMRGAVYPFFVGKNSHPTSFQIHDRLNDMLVRLNEQAWAH